MYITQALSGLPLFKKSFLAAPAEVALHLALRKGDSSALTPPLYDGAVTHHYNKRRRDLLGRIPAYVTPSPIYKYPEHRL